MKGNKNLIKISPAVPSESSGIENINKKAFPHDFTCDWIFLSPVVSRYIYEMIQESKFCKKSPEFFTAHFDNHLAGYFNIKNSSDRVHLNYLAVDPVFQRKGLARKMLAFLEEFCLHQLNIKTINVEVNKNNEAGLNLYKNSGFKTTNNTKFLYQIEVNKFPLKECSFEIINWLETEAWQYTYGISYFLLSIDGCQPIKIGRLGNHYWRINDINCLNYEGLGYALKSIESNRVLVFIRTDSMIPNFPDIHVTFWEMEKLL